MKKRTMQKAIDAMDRGDKLPSHLEAESERDEQFAESLYAELQAFLVQWHQRNAIAVDAIEPALMRAMAVRLMAQGMTPDDVADFARYAARRFEPEAREVRRQAAALGRT